jgi:hypothetical protein
MQLCHARFSKRRANRAPTHILLTIGLSGNHGSSLTWTTDRKIKNILAGLVGDFGIK